MGQCRTVVTKRYQIRTCFNTQYSVLVMVLVHKKRQKGGEPVSKYLVPDSAWVWRVIGLTRDGTAELVPLDNILHHFSCSADHEQDWQQYRLMPDLPCVYVPQKEGG